MTAQLGGFPADAVLGVAGYVSRGAERMAVLAGARESFARAQGMLRELAGWSLDDEAIRRLTHATATRIAAARPDRGDAGRFDRSPGVVEVQIDAGKVPTTAGWRDVKLAVFARREPGEPAAPSQWDDRQLPAPAIRVVVAAVEEAGDFARRVRREADRLAATAAQDVTVLGDGAQWIWNLAAEVLPQADGVLDVYHAVEHIGTAAKSIWPDPAAAERHRVAGRTALLAAGKPGVEGWIAASFRDLPEGCDGEPLRELAGYLAHHPRRLGYADRLGRGLSIGSGLVEGSVKHLVNRRLKLSGARWLVGHVGPLVELAALIDTPDWDAAWTAA